MQEFPPGYFRLGGWTATNHSQDADCWVLPCDIRHVTDKQIMGLPYLQEHESQHVFFSLSEFPQRALPIDAIAFRTDYNAQLAKINPNTMAWCWGVEDLEQYAPIPEKGFAFDVHAQMWASTPLTDQAVESCLRAGLTVHDQRNAFFYGTLETAKDPRLAVLRRTFLESMQQSRLVLVPRSREGVNRYRFYEALSMGRVPVLLCNDCLLPFPVHPIWESCIVRFWQQDVNVLGAYLQQLLELWKDEDLLMRGKALRSFWKQYLKGEVWEQMWGEVVAAKLEQQFQLV